jgi:integrase
VRAIQADGDTRSLEPAVPLAVRRLRREAALKDALHSGRKPRDVGGGGTVLELVDSFLIHKQALVNVGELSPRTWVDYKVACDQLVAAFGKRRPLDGISTDDFSQLRNELAERWGPHRLGKMIQSIRCVFKFAFEAGAISSPMRHGPGSKRPSRKVMRLNRAKQGPKLFTAEEIRGLLAVAGPSMKAVILLGINAGFGNSDCGKLPLAAVDLEAGWVTYPRPKTGVARRCKLWPETVEAIQDALAERMAPKGKANAALVFITKYGESWAKDGSDNPISKEMRKLLDATGISGHRNFYALRHTFRTVADETKDQPAVDFIMGHEMQHMATAYRETISDGRLQAVADKVREWLFGGLQHMPDVQSGYVFSFGLNWPR